MTFGSNAVKAGWRWALILLHVLLWAALALQAYRTAGAYKFASCWQIIPIYFPPLSMLLWAIALSSFLVVLVAIFHPSVCRHASFWVACHGMILTAGLLVCNYSAYAAAGQVSCL
ncbi:hypothetical protein HFO41_13025 [Rhizobium leguminosarum]|uniref:hypothetical protein n=1 Tax=Rhizobium leguminosarum TaxID=384 RepID=UPI001A92132E|nr:hypothetical protein [Rhizobium leguminosarum]MBY5554376.1 hypothetical protein [Rhizobium leguminosarum]MBY5689734.1 hypothetical protein [Rhizobium leguminosarum]MBY5722009.1 hypothetical protein [Rhizobium leguminosarum]QSW22293.1 hypothetical protein J0664_16060 [Rhizobium leguminosarum]